MKNVITIIAIIVLGSQTLEAQRRPCNGAFTWQVVNYNIDVAAVQFTSENQDGITLHKWWINGILVDSSANPIFVLPVVPYPPARISHCNECFDICNPDCASCTSRLIIINAPTSLHAYTYGAGLPIGTRILVGDLIGRGLRFEYFEGRLNPGEIIFTIFD